MSPSQLEDELDAAGLKVMEVGDISPPSMEAWGANSKINGTQPREGWGGYIGGTVGCVPRIWMDLSIFLLVPI